MFDCEIPVVGTATKFDVALPVAASQNVGQGSVPPPRVNEVGPMLAKSSPATPPLLSITM